MNEVPSRCGQYFKTSQTSHYMTETTESKLLMYSSKAIKVVLTLTDCSVYTVNVGRYTIKILSHFELKGSSFQTVEDKSKSLTSSQQPSIFPPKITTVTTRLC